MTLDLKQDFFALFGLPPRFGTDIAALDARYRELQREVHPDRFAAASQTEQRVSMQLSTRVNEAYQTLKSPLRRAGYLLQLHGVDPQFETDTAMPAEFLAGQMELRESLEEAAKAGDPARLGELASRLRIECDALLAQIATQLDAQGAWRPAAATLRRLMFMEKFRNEIDAAEERLEN